MKRAIFPGSFDPITNGHLYILKKSLEVFDEVILLVAINPNKTPRFSIKERVQMINESISNIKGAKVDFTDGFTVDYAHKANTNSLIRGYRNDDDMEFETELAKAYHKQDNDIQIMYIKADEELMEISSSGISELIKQGKDISNYVPPAVVEMYKKKWTDWFTLFLINYFFSL